MKRLFHVMLFGVIWGLVGCGGGRLPPQAVPQSGGVSHAATAGEASRADTLKESPAVAPEEQMKTYPSPGMFVAFSLATAQKMLTAVGKHTNYRTAHPEVFNLAGINHLHGLVHDRQRQEVILVGTYDPELQPLTLDDFVVALKAKFIHSQQPLVSIDPTEETAKTQMQRVRFEGGIEDTQFGSDLLEADYRLKRIGIGVLPAGVAGLASHWDLSEERARQGHLGTRWEISARFWFYPVQSKVLVREDVAAIKGLQVGVFTEVLSAVIDGKQIADLTTFQDSAGETFAKTVTDKFGALAKGHPAISRVQGLDEVVALVEAIDRLDPKPDLAYWLAEYPVKKVETPKQLKVLKRKGAYQGMSGGVQLMAIALRLEAGDVTALKEAVLRTRPGPEALRWSFVVGEWLIPTAPGMLKVEDVTPLLTQAGFLQEKERYDDAIALYGKVIELKPDWDWPYNNRGAAYGEKGAWERAVADFNRALQLNPESAEVYYNRGFAYGKKGAWDQALADFTRALQLNPRNAGAYSNRGAAYANKGKIDKACSDFKRACELGNCQNYQLAKTTGQCR